MLIDPTCTRIASGGWRTNSKDAVPESATRLLVAGPSHGENLAASESFVATADGALSAPVLVSLGVTGGTATRNPASATLAPGGSVSFSITPTSLGDLTLTFSAPGLLSASAVYTSESPEVLKDLTDKWFINADPNNPWEASQGVVPAGVIAHPGLIPPLESKAGLANIIRLSATLADTVSVIQRDVHKTYDDPPENRYPLTPTEFRCDALSTSSVPSTYPLQRRIADPDMPGKWLYETMGDKTKLGFHANSVKWRGLVQTTGTTRFNPWGTEEWFISSLWLHPEWVQAARGPYYNVCEYHDASGGLTGGAALETYIQPGGGDPNALAFETKVKVYKTDKWPQSQEAGYKTNHVLVRTPSGGIPTEEHFFLIYRYVTGCGLPDYPGYNPNANPPQNPNNYGPDWSVYGPLDPDDVFIEFYFARWDGDPELLFRWDGFWGSPHVTTQTAAEKQQAGYWASAGVYTSMKFNGVVGNLFGIRSRGFTQFRARDVPDAEGPISVLDVIAAFKALRD